MIDGDRLIEHVRGRLLAEPQPPGDLVPEWMPEVTPETPPVAAAVLIGLVRRPDGLGLLYTERSPALRSHSGQISFPGGRIDPGDAGPADAALREANEEVALHRPDATVLGFMPTFLTGSNYLITPVIASIVPTAPFVPSPDEVKTVFEVPLELLAHEKTYGRYLIRRGATEHSTWQIEHGGLRIWGMTANLTRRFRDLALSGDAPW